ncbi:MAG: hypothetical protein M5U28_03935 [Sandaracinaceae bacterium]|nr:hypothetical protein [Sandaracinaceae bacterium]
MPRHRVLTAAALFAAMLPALACGLGDKIQQSAFEASCVAECVANADRPTCESYCQCTYRWAADNGRMPELERVRVDNTGPMEPVMVDVMVACGSDLYDAAFNRGCVESCAAAADRAQCQTECACMLRELRGPGPRPESTRFLVTNLDQQPPTPAGQARMDAAQAACLPR